MARGLAVRLRRRPRVGRRHHGDHDRARVPDLARGSPRSMGPFDGYAPNADAMLRVIAQAPRRRRRDRRRAGARGHAHAPRSSRGTRPSALGELHGYRNAQASVLAPTGHDRADDGLRHHRHRARARARQDQEAGRRRHDAVREPDGAARARQARLRRATQIEDIVAYIAEHNSVVDAPHLNAEHYAVFDTAMGARADPLHGPRADDGRGAAVHLRRHLQDREHAGGGHGRRGRAALRGVVEAGPEGGRDLPRQLQGRPAAVGRQEEERADAARSPRELAHPVAQAPAACRARPRPPRSRWATPRATSPPAPTPTTAWARSS